MASKTRDKLIEVARQLFAHKGVAHTTMNDLASASSKGRRTIYTYFRNKKEIYDAVLEQESERLVNSLREVVAMDAPVDKRLRLFMRLRYERYMMTSGSATLKSRISFDSRRIAKIRLLARDKEIEIVRTLMDEGCKQGIFNPERCKLVEGFICFSTSAIGFHNIDAGAEKDLEKAYDDFVEFLVRGVMIEK